MPLDKQVPAQVLLFPGRYTLATSLGFIFLTCKIEIITTSRDLFGVTWNSACIPLLHVDVIYEARVFRGNTQSTLQIPRETVDKKQTKAS